MIKWFSMNQGGASANDHGRGRNTGGSTCQISRVAACRCPNRALTESTNELIYMYLAMGLKYFDYTMSGILLFIVTWRAKFVAKGDESLWWHICRIFNSILLTIFCLFGIPLMSTFFLSDMAHF